MNLALSHAPNELCVCGLVSGALSHAPNELCVCGLVSGVWNIVNNCITYSLSDSLASTAGYGLEGSLYNNIQW